MKNIYNLTCRVELEEFCKNSTNLGTIPVWMTSSMGGFGSLLSSFLNFADAAICNSGSLLYKSWIMSWVIHGVVGEEVSLSNWNN